MTNLLMPISSNDNVWIRNKISCIEVETLVELLKNTILKWIFDSRNMTMANEASFAKNFIIYNRKVGQMNKILRYVTIMGDNWSFF